MPPSFPGAVGLLWGSCVTISWPIHLALRGGKGQVKEYIVLARRGAEDRRRELKQPDVAPTRAEDVVPT